MSKLTLSVDPKVVARAKRYAKKHHVSVSSMVETYLASVSKQEEGRLSIDDAPITRSLAGILEGAKIGDYRKEYYDYLWEKYK